MTLDIPCCNHGNGFYDNGFKLQNAVIGKLKDEFGVDDLNKIADHQMFFVPQGVVGGAYGYVPGSLTVYGDSWDGTSVLMHEVGHNLGMSHSSENGGEYGDESCILGGGFSENGPLTCYNGAKSPKEWIKLLPIILVIVTVILVIVND